MAFKPNYRRDRAERQRVARARTEEKQRKKEEKAALRKAEREAAKPRRMRSKRPGSLEGYWFRETPPFLCRECRRICDRLSASGASTTCIHAPSARTAASSSTANLQ